MNPTRTDWLNKIKTLLEARKVNPKLVSTRLPGKGPHPRGAQKLEVGMEPVDQDPKYMEKLAKHLSAYSIAGPAEKQSRDPAELIGDVQKKVERNLEWGIERYQRDLPVEAGRSEGWYPGASKITKRFSDRFGHPEEVVATVLASQSPQKDWYQNVSLGERILHIHREHQETPWSREMEQTTAKVFKKNKKHQAILGEIRGKRLADLSDPVHKAAWIRLYDEAHHPSHYREITPEGEFGDHVVGQSGKKNKVAWQGFATIAKAVKAIESKGDMDILDNALGKKHKVRSFYNNMLDPAEGEPDTETPEIVVPSKKIIAPSREVVTPSEPSEEPRGSVTGDTWHFRAANAKPGEPSNSKMISAGLGGSPSSKKIGLHGTYGLYATATRNVAGQRGMRPSAAQSVVWDMYRTIPTPKGRKENIEKLHGALKSGEMSHEDFLKAMDKEVGTTIAPTWANTSISQKRESTFLSEAVRKIIEKLQKII